MTFEYKHLIPENFSDHSKVWLYQASRLFTLGEALEIEDMLNEFVSGWMSHGAPVKGYANLLFGQFIVLMADETQTSVGGCSTDSSVRLIKSIETRFKADMFNRQNLAFIIKGKVQLLPLTQLQYAVANHFVDESTIYFNNVVLTKEELLNKWMIPLSESWLAKKMAISAK